MILGKMKKNKVRKKNGQVLVLGALTMLIVVVCLFMTIGVAWQTRTRIQLQQMADSRAFADATLTARIYNSFAYSNRAIAGNIVSMTILHSFHTEVGATSDVFFVAVEALLPAPLGEIAKGTLCIGPICIPCGKPQHCFVHAPKATVQLAKALAAWVDGTMGKRIKNTDKSFHNAMGAIEGANKKLLVAQKMMSIRLNTIGADVGGTGGGDSAMDNYNLKQGASVARSPVLIGKKNIQKDDDGNAAKKKIELTEIANAARPAWVRNRMPNIAMAPLFLSRVNDAIKDKVSSWKSGIIAQLPYAEAGGAAFYTSKPETIYPTILETFVNSNLDSNREGKMIGSHDVITLTGVVDVGCNWPGHGTSPFIAPINASYLASGEQSSSHTSGSLFELFNKAHSGEQHRIKLKKNNEDTGVFGFASYAFAALDHADEDFYQPYIFSKATVSSLSVSPDSKSGSTARLPWDLKFKIKLDSRESDVDLKNDREATAISKSLTYYHHPGNWMEPPNFWAPFWRAKLNQIYNTDVAVFAFLGAADAGILLAPSKNRGSR